MASVSEGRTAVGSGLTIPGAERLIWYFIRISGVLLIFLAGGHMFITHYLHVPSETVFTFVAARWANPLWRTFDWMLLMSALWHGVLGLRYSIQDYLRAPAARTAGLGLMWALGFVFLALGSVTIFTFDADAAAANEGPLADAMWIAHAIGWSLYAFAIVTYVAVSLLAVWLVRAYLVSGQLPLYSGGPGQYAWIFHRASGIGILFFLLVHIIDIALIGLGQAIYDESVAFYADPFLIPMEIMLVGAVVYHTLNGLRVMSIDFIPQGNRQQKVSWYVVLILTVLLTLPSALLILRAEL